MSDFRSGIPSNLAMACWSSNLEKGSRDGREYWSRRILNTRQKEVLP